MIESSPSHSQLLETLSFSFSTLAFSHLLFLRNLEDGPAVLSALSSLQNIPGCSSRFVY